MNVLIVTTHRSDKAHYDRLLRVLRSDDRFRVTLYAYNRACEQGAPKDPLSHMRPLAQTRHKVEPEHFDAGIVLGDRYEMLLAAMQIVEARIPLLHIHGGEHTYGSLDERWRWAMTTIADVHCVATSEAEHEVLSRSPDLRLQRAVTRFTDVYRTLSLRVIVTGAPGLDEIAEGRIAPTRAPQVVVLYNPAIDEDMTVREATAIGQACARIDKSYFMPNGDRYSEALPWNTEGHEMEFGDFRNVLAAARVIVGNSSAGIIEAPSLGTWAVNVGERQAGRVRAGNVIDVPADADVIRTAILDALSCPRFSGPNPYRHPEGRACEAIRDVLLEMGAR